MCWHPHKLVLGGYIQSYPQPGELGPIRVGRHGQPRQRLALVRVQAHGAAAPGKTRRAQHRRAAPVARATAVRVGEANAAVGECQFVVDRGRGRDGAHQHFAGAEAAGRKRAASAPVRIPYFDARRHAEILL